MIQNDMIDLYVVCRQYFLGTPHAQPTPDDSLGRASFGWPTEADSNPDGNVVAKECDLRIWLYGCTECQQLLRICHSISHNRCLQFQLFE